MPNFTEQLRRIVGDDATVGLVIVDHGSRRQQSNALLDEVVAMFKQTTGAMLVEPAHMELAEPSISTALDRCVEQGADWVVVFPYFLSPGRHWHADIPQLAAEAAAKHPGVRHLVTAPLGLHEGMASIMQDRMTHCLSRVLGQADACYLCDATSGCKASSDPAIQQQQQ